MRKARGAFTSCKVDDVSIDDLLDRLNEFDVNEVRRQIRAKLRGSNGSTKPVIAIGE